MVIGGGGAGGGVTGKLAHTGIKKRANDKKTCRWVLDNGTVCGRSFSKFDSLRRHVQELHKGVRPFACNQCDKTYGRKDYLDRHIRSHLAASEAVEVGLTSSATVITDDKTSLLVHSNEVLASLADKDSVMLDDDDDDNMQISMGGDVVTVVGAVDDEDDDLAV